MKIAAFRPMAGVLGNRPPVLAQATPAPPQQTAEEVPEPVVVEGPGIATYVAGTIAVIGLLAAGGVFK